MSCNLQHVCKIFKMVHLIFKIIKVKCRLYIAYLSLVDAISFTTTFR